MMEKKELQERTWRKEEEDGLGRRYHSVVPKSWLPAWDR